MKKKRDSRLNRLDEATLKETFQKSSSFSSWARRLGFPNASGGTYYELKKKANQLGLKPSFDLKGKTDHPRHVSDEIYFARNTQHGGNEMRIRILKEKLLPYRCEVCGLEGFWQNQPLTLQLDHKNGDHSDNRLENLRFLCPNCHAQTENFGGKNIRKDLKEKPERRCQKCGKKITRYSRSGLCPSCSAERSRLVKRPPKEIFLKQVTELGFAGTGKAYGISESGIRGWCSFYHLPSRMALLKSINYGKNKLSGCYLFTKKSRKMPEL
jgi:Zn finger protein HypA/HybF involved in hydrogenase expression